MSEGIAESNSIDRGIGNIDEPKLEIAEKDVEYFAKHQYEEWLKYMQESEKIPEFVLSGLRAHNGEVMNAAIDIAQKEGVIQSENDKNELKLAALLHDLTKFSKGENNAPFSLHLPEHGHLGAEFARHILNGGIKKDELRIIAGLNLDPEIAEEIALMIERHNIYPYVVKGLTAKIKSDPNFLTEKEKSDISYTGDPGNPLPKPETAKEKVLYDADCLAQITPKNISFRLNTSADQEADLKATINPKTGERTRSYLRALLANIMDSVDEALGTLYFGSSQKLGMQKREKLERFREDFLKIADSNNHLNSINSVVEITERRKEIIDLLNHTVGKFFPEFKFF